MPHVLLVLPPVSERPARLPSLIIWLREQLGLALHGQAMSQDDFGRLLDRSRGPVSSWETGASQPPTAKFRHLLDCAGFGEAERAWAWEVYGAFPDAYDREAPRAHDTKDCALAGG